MSEKSSVDELVEDGITDAIQFCSESKDDRGHCRCWWECEPCCWCGSEEGGEDCDCPKHAAMRGECDD